MEEQYVVGVDFGTLSGRAVVVRVSDGAELGSAVTDYPNAVVERTLPETGERLGSSWALQDPDDWREEVGRWTALVRWSTEPAENRMDTFDQDDIRCVTSQP